MSQHDQLLFREVIVLQKQQQQLPADMAVLKCGNQNTYAAQHVL